MAKQRRGRPARSERGVPDGASRLIRAALLLLVVLVPAAMTNLRGIGALEPLTLDVFGVPKVLVTALLVGAAGFAWVWNRLAGGSPLWRPKSVSLLVAGLALVVLSAVFARNASTAIFGSNEYKMGLVVWLALGLLLFLVVQVVRSPVYARQLLAAVAFGGAFVAIYQLVQFAGLDPIEWSESGDWAVRGFSTIGNANTVAGYLLFPLGASAAMALSSADSMRKTIWWSVGLVILVAIATSLTRSAWLGAAAVAASGGVFAWRMKARLSVRDIAFSAAAPLLAFLIVTAVNIRSSGGVVVRLAELASPTSFTGSGRLPLWRESIRVISLNPGLGVGADSFRFGWFGVTSGDGMGFGYRIIADDAHSLPLMLAATVGIPAALLLLVWVGRVMWSSARFLGGAPSATSARLVWGGWWSGLAGYLVFSLFSPQALVSWVLATVTLGVLLAPDAVRVEPAGPRRWLPAVGVAVVAALSLAFGLLTWAADVQASNAERAASSVEEIAALERATTLAPWSYEYRSREAYATASKVLQTAPGSLTDDTIAEARLAYGALLEDHPGQYEAYVRYSQFLRALSDEGLADAYQEAADVGERALTLYPRGLGAAMSAGAAWSQLGRYDRTAELLQPLWDVDPREIDPGLQYARALVALERPSEAATVVAELEERFPGDPRLAEVLSSAEGAGTTQ